MTTGLQSALQINKALQIEGWMEPQELVWLASRAATHEVIVEIGSYKGRSTRVLADNCPGVIYSIDPYVGPYYQVDGSWKDSDGKSERAEFMDNLADHLETSKVIQFKGVIQDFKPLKKPDFIFIDGMHTYDFVSQDIAASLALLNGKGLISGHDYSPHFWLDVKKAVNEVFGKVNVCDTIWWVEL